EVNPDGEVNVVVDVEQGPLFKIGTPRLTSPDGKAGGILAEKSAPYVGKDATTTNISGMRKDVTEAFTGTGYANAKVMMGRSLVGDRFVADFTIDPGKRVKLR